MPLRAAYQANTIECSKPLLGQQVQRKRCWSSVREAGERRLPLHGSLNFLVQQIGVQSCHKLTCTAQDRSRGRLGVGGRRTPTLLNRSHALARLTGLSCLLGEPARPLKYTCATRYSRRRSPLPRLPTRPHTGDTAQATMPAPQQSYDMLAKVSSRPTKPAGRGTRRGRPSTADSHRTGGGTSSRLEGARELTRCSPSADAADW